MTDDPSSLEAELRAHLGMQATDDADLSAVVLAIHRVGCPELPCHHVLDEVDEIDRWRGRAALLALGRHSAAGYSAARPREIAQLYAAGRISRKQMLEELSSYPYDQSTLDELRRAYDDRLLSQANLQRILDR